ncbi:MAG TPA: extracellular solute-binding protein [Devosia sp.]|nr:extracellular solute-binding protein [Devosia sp.]
MQDNDEGGSPKKPMGANRRDMLRAMAALGLTTGVLGRFGISAAFGADFDWKKYAGTKLSILMTGDENDHRALADLMPQFESDTGMTLEVTSPALGPLIEKTLQNLQAPQSSFELINYLGFLTTQQVGAGYYEELNSYLEDPAQTPPDWDFADFLPPAVANVSIFDIPSGTLGKGDRIYGIPALHSGSVILFYRKDLFDAAGLQPPKTWEEFHDAAVKLHTGDVAGASFIGANDFSLATVDWFTRFITTGGKLMSGSPQGKDFKPNVDSPEGVGALQMLIDLLPYAPANVTKYGFAENVDGFSTGKIAQMIFWSTIAGPIFNPENSMVAETTGTAPVPAKPGEVPRAIQGGWGLGIPKNADPAKKAAAWLALTWLTSKAFNKYETETYQIDASRISSYNDPDLVTKFPYLTDSLAASSTAEVIPTSLIPEFFQLNDIMNVEFNAALLGTQDAKTACSKVQAQWEDVLRKAGHLA